MHELLLRWTVRTGDRNRPHGPQRQGEPFLGGPREADERISAGKENREISVSSSSLRLVQDVRAEEAGCSASRPRLGTRAGEGRRVNRWEDKAELGMAGIW